MQVFVCVDSWETFVWRKRWNLRLFKGTLTGHLSSGTTVSSHPPSPWRPAPLCSVAVVSDHVAVVVESDCGSVSWGDHDHVAHPFLHCWFHQNQSHNPLHLLPSSSVSVLFMFDIPALKFMSGKRHWWSVEDDDALTEVILLVSALVWMVCPFSYQNIRARTQ